MHSACCTSACLAAVPHWKPNLETTALTTSLTGSPSRFTEHLQIVEACSSALWPPPWTVLNHHIRTQATAGSHLRLVDHLLCPASVADALYSRQRVLALSPTCCCLAFVAEALYSDPPVPNPVIKALGFSLQEPSTSCIQAEQGDPALSPTCCACSLTCCAQNPEHPADTHVTLRQPTCAACSSSCCARDLKRSLWLTSTRNMACSPSSAPSAACGAATLAGAASKQHKVLGTLGSLQCSWGTELEMR